MDLEAELKAAQDELDALMAKPEWTPEEQARAKELTDSIASLQEQMDSQMALTAEADDLRAGYADRQKQLAKPRGRKTSTLSSTPLNIGNAREAFEEDPKCGFKSHREFLSSVIHATKRGRVEDKRLKFLTAGSDEHGTYADGVGGFLLPKGLSPDVLSIGVEDDPIGALTTKIPMEEATVEINARVDKNHSTSVSGGLVVGRRAETQAASASRTSWEQVTMRATSLFGLGYGTRELIDRSPSSFVAILEAGFKDEFPAKLIDERLNGTGTGMFEGVINAPATVSVAKETGQAAASILFENVVKMRARCWGYGNAIWLANHDTLPQLMLMNQNVGTGGFPVWQPSAREDHPDMLFGRPMYFTEFTQTVGTTGDLLLGNWSQYLEGTLTDMKSESSTHVRFIEHEETFKFWMENDGRCWWRTALTPKRSTATLSPFVKLDTRA